MKTLKTSIQQKKAIICQHMLPALGITTTMEDTICTDIAYYLEHRHGLRLEDLEEPGAWHEGCAWFSERPLFHRYYYCTDSYKNWGIEVIRRYHWHLDTDSLINGTSRREFVQLLESGHIWSLPYPALQELMDGHPALKLGIEKLARQQAHYHHMHNHFLNKPFKARILDLHEQYQAIMSRLSRPTQSMHVHMSRGHYLELLKELQKEKKL